MTEFELGWLVGVIDADAGIYSEPRVMRRVLVLDIETANEHIAMRVARLIGASNPTVRAARPKSDHGWRRPLHRVRLRGPRAAALLDSVYRHVSPDTRERIDRARSEARVGGDPLSA